MAADSHALIWRDVPGEHVRAWRSIFDVSMEGINLRTGCPVCSSGALHRWFYLHRENPTTSFGRKWQGDGSQWQWCSSCYSYEHSSGLVPAWWHPAFEVAPELLQHDPEAIEAERLKRNGR